MEINCENFSKKVPDFIFNRLVAGKNVLVDAPPGLGKTRSGAKVAVKLVKETEKRILIIEPTKTLRRLVTNYIRQEDKEIEFHESKGWADYRCPIIGASADPSFCSFRKETCKCERIKCDVLSDIEKVKTSKLTVATFAKFLLARGLFADYDIFIIDESHGFENAERSFLQSYVMIDKLSEVSQELECDFPELSEKLRKLAEGLRRLEGLCGNSTPLTIREIGLIKEFLDDSIFRDVWVECVRQNKHPSYRNLYSNLSSLHFKMQNLSKNLFFFYEGALYGRPKNMELEISNFFRNKDVCLLSATIDDPIEHAKGCGLDMRRFDESCALMLKDYPAQRRRNRKLIAISNGPSLTRSDEYEYQKARDVANRFLFEILKKFPVKTLVLFRGYNDQKLAWEFLRDTEIKNRVHNIWQGEDPEMVEDKINKLKESDIVLSSASTRLWEGVDIPGLRLVIIDALPYPGKDPLSREYNFKEAHQVMIKKLKQGLGRIVRSNDDWGAAIVIDRRFVQRFSYLAPKLPWYMDEDFEKLPFDHAIEELEKFISARRNTGNEGNNC